MAVDVGPKSASGEPDSSPHEVVWDVLVESLIQLRWLFNSQFKVINGISGRSPIVQI